MKIYDNGTLRDMTDEEVKEHEEFFMSIPDDEPEYEGYTFLHWKDGDDNTYSAGDSILILDDTTFYAQWVETPVPPPVPPEPEPSKRNTSESDLLVYATDGSGLIFDSATFLLVYAT